MFLVAHPFACSLCVRDVFVFHLQLKIWEKLSSLSVACNVMLSYKVVYKSMEKEGGGKVICSNEHWKSTGK